MNEVTIAGYDEAMLVPLVDMWRASFEFGVGIVDPHPIQGQREYFTGQVLTKNDVDVALRDGEIVGFLAASRESIAQLYVRVGCHRRGIGTRLLQLAQSRSSGSLWLYTFAQNTVARRFYERHGFVDVGHGFENMWQMEDVRYEWRRAGAA
jgi:ribosomal protein S18 acetylase RimI-like enzyme